MIKDKFGWGTLEYGFISTAGGFIAIVSQVAGFNNLHPVIGKHGAGMVGFSCSTIALGCVAAFDASWSGAQACTLVATGILSVGIALTNPSISTTLSEHASASAQGQTLGVSQALQALVSLSMLGGRRKRVRLKAHPFTVPSLSLSLSLSFSLPLSLSLFLSLSLSLFLFLSFSVSLSLSLPLPLSPSSPPQPSPELSAPSSSEVSTRSRPCGRSGWARSRPSLASSS